MGERHAVRFGTQTKAKKRLLYMRLLYMTARHLPLRHLQFMMRQNNRVPSSYLPKKDFLCSVAVAEAACMVLCVATLRAPTVSYITAAGEMAYRGPCS